MCRGRMAARALTPPSHLSLGDPQLTPGSTLRLELPFALSPGAIAAVRALEAEGVGGRAVGDDANAVATAAATLRATTAGVPSNNLYPRRDGRSFSMEAASLGVLVLIAAALASLTRRAWRSAQERARRDATTTRAAASRAAARAGALPNALPVWLTGPAVWRVRLATGGEANVPLPPPPDAPAGTAATRCWLAWEAQADAVAWAAWLAGAGLGGAASVRAAPETLSEEAAAAGRELVYVPAGAVRVAPGDAEASALASLAARAHERRGGAAIVRPELRVVREDEGTPNGETATIVAEEVAVEIVPDEPPAPSPTGRPPAPPPPILTAASVGARGWYRTLPFVVVPVLRLDGDEGSLLVLHGVGARGGADGEGPPGAVVAFEKHDDAHRLARLWHVSGAGAANGADIGRVVAITPEQLDEAAAEYEADPVVFRAGSMPLPARASSQQVLQLLAAGVAAQLGEEG